MSIRSITILSILCAGLCAGLLIPSCGPTRKIQRTLNLNDLSREARTATAQGENQRAVELWSEYVDRRPHSDVAQYNLGMSLLTVGSNSQAVGHLTTAHDLVPGNIQYIEGLADAYIAADRPEDMLSLMTETVGEGGFVAGNLRFADYAQKVGMLDEAKQAIRSAMVFSGGESMDPYMAMADFASEIGNRELEIKSLRQALWFDRSSGFLDQRFSGLGVTPGPSLAIDPRLEID